MDTSEMRARCFHRSTFLQSLGGAFGFLRKEPTLFPRVTYNYPANGNSGQFPMSRSFGEREQETFAFGQLCADTT